MLVVYCQWYFHHQQHHCHHHPHYNCSPPSWWHQQHIVIIVTNIIIITQSWAVSWIWVFRDRKIISSSSSWIINRAIIIITFSIVIYLAEESSALLQQMLTWCHRGTQEQQIRRQWYIWNTHSSFLWQWYIQNIWCSTKLTQHFYDNYTSETDEQPIFNETHPTVVTKKIPATLSRPSRFTSDLTSYHCFDKDRMWKMLIGGTVSIENDNFVKSDSPHRPILYQHICPLLASASTISPFSKKF